MYIVSGLDIDMLHCICNEKGGAIVFLVLMLAVLMSVVLMVMLDVNNAMQVSRELDAALDIASKAASSRIDWDVVPLGQYVIDEDEAFDFFIEKFERNFLSDGQTLTESFQWEFTFASPQTGNKVTIYTEVINTGFPRQVTLGRYPHVVDVSVTRPTFAAFAVIEYNRAGLWGRDILYIRRVAVSQLTMN
jgi:hypothetical protein